jgi:hypothetical protein
MTAVTTSQVSLPSQTGATAVIMACRSGSLRVKPNNMPTPRSKPSSST